MAIIRDNRASRNNERPLPTLEPDHGSPAKPLTARDLIAEPPPTAASQSSLKKAVRDEMRKKQIVGESPQLLAAVERAIRVAPTDTSVLIIGKNGTGKEKLARIIHDRSQRKHKPYVTVNCGALPEGTINSELFGHKKGSFTGADTDHAGFFEKADGGTIFLDEVADLPLNIQVLLLRVIEYGEFYRMGETAPRKTNVRVIAATNRDMRTAVQNGQFREDLFFRLAGVQITLPSLSERGSDIGLLVNHFISMYTDANHTVPPKLTAGAMSALERYAWPGNVRQLINITNELCGMEAGNIVTEQRLRESLPDMEPANVPAPTGDKSHYDYNHDREYIFGMIMQLRNEVNSLKEMLNSGAATAGETPHVSTHIDELHRKPHQLTMSTLNDYHDRHYNDIDVEEYLADDRLQDLGHADEVHHTAAPAAAGPAVRSLGEMQRMSIEDALNEFAGNRRKTAEALGISERTLYRKIKQYGLE